MRDMCKDCGNKDKCNWPKDGVYRCGCWALDENDKVLKEIMGNAGDK